MSVSLARSLIQSHLSSLLDLSPLVDQQLRHLGKVPADGLLERRPAEPVDGVDGRALPEEPLRHLVAALGGGEVERGPLVVVAAGGFGDLKAVTRERSTREEKKRKSKKEEYGEKKIPRSQPYL